VEVAHGKGEVKHHVWVPTCEIYVFFFQMVLIFPAFIERNINYRIQNIPTGTDHEPSQRISLKFVLMSLLPLVFQVVSFLLFFR